MQATENNSLEQVCNSYEYCYDHLGQARRVLMQFDGVVGVGIGPKQTKARLDPDQLCFVVYVDEKKEACELDANSFVPREFAGVATDVVQVGSRVLPVHNEFDARWLERSAVAQMA
jgi:hypothetical protein